MDFAVANITIRKNISFPQNGVRLYRLNELLCWGIVCECVIDPIITTQKTRKNEEKFFHLRLSGRLQTLRGLGALKPVQECTSKDLNLLPLALHGFSYAHKHTTSYVILV